MKSSFTREQYAYLNKEWHKYLIEFYSESKYEITLTNNYVISIADVVGSGINLSTKYGFLCLNFPSETQKMIFLDLLGIKILKTQISHDFQHITTQWDRELYPVRFFPEASKKSIAIYREVNANFDNMDAWLKFYKDIHSKIHVSILLYLQQQKAIDPTLPN